MIDFIDYLSYGEAKQTPGCGCRPTNVLYWELSPADTTNCPVHEGTPLQDGTLIQRIPPGKASMPRSVPEGSRKRKPHWSEAADRVYDTHGLYVGESSDGTWWVPSRKHSSQHPQQWGRRLNLRNPTHWIYWLRSWLDHKLAYLD